MASTKPLEDRLSHRFSNPDLLTTALTHASMLAAHHPRAESNERQEFLGDRVLGLIVAEMLYHRFSGEDEGSLARRHAALVSRETLARVARDIELGDEIRMMAGEAATGGRVNPALLANCCEAVIAALFLDGGLDVAGRFVRDQWAPLVEELTAPPKDNKTALQEWAQAAKRGLPVYQTVAADGPAHAPVFRVRVRVEAEGEAEAEGPSKRVAEQAAAGVFLARIGIET